MNSDSMTNRTAWSIYADVLDLIAWTFFGSIFFGVVGALVGALLSGGDSSAVFVGGVIGASLVLPVTATMRAGRIRKWARKQA